MSKYDYIIAGRWRDHSKVKAVLDAIRATGKTAYCFIDNEYDGDGIKQTLTPEPAQVAVNHVEGVTDWQTNPTVRQIFENDMNGLRESEAFVVVMPAGFSAHMELGVAYGMGKKCYAIGEPEKVETLYLMFDAIYSDVRSFIDAQIGAAA